MIGKTLSHYSILEKIGAGGMGEVYRAHDTKLDRDVALKILPETFIDDPERLARFEREAKLLASLNHANIASIHGLEQSDSTDDHRRLVPSTFPGPGELGDETTALVHIWNTELLGLLWNYRTNQREAVLELALWMILAKDEDGDLEITYQSPSEGFFQEAGFVTLIIFCLGIAPLLASVWGGMGSHSRRCHRDLGVGRAGSRPSRDSSADYWRC